MKNQFLKETMLSMKSNGNKKYKGGSSQNFE